MSQSEVQTAIEATPPHPSLIIRARSPHLQEPTDSPDKEGKGSPAIELVELGHKPSKDGASAATIFAQYDPPPPPTVSARARRKAHIQFVTLCWTLFTLGWNDGTTGPLLPRIQRVYHVGLICHSTYRSVDSGSQVGFAVVSLIFVFQCLVRYIWSSLTLLCYYSYRASFWVR